MRIRSIDVTIGQSTNYCGVSTGIVARIEGRSEKRSNQHASFGEALRQSSLG
jgi:hypothetical protein